MRFHALYLTLLLYGCSESQQKVMPQKIDMVEAVYSSVIIEPEDVYVVYSTVPGIISDLSKEEGDQVKNGDLLCRIANTPIRLNEENASLNYSLAKQNYEGEANRIQEFEMELQTAGMKLKNDSVSFVRMKNLFDRKIVSKSEFDLARLNYELAQNNYSNLTKRNKRLKVELNNQMRQSFNLLNASVSKTEEYALRSNLEGMIFQLNKKRGEFIGMQEPFATIGRVDSYLLSMRIDEVDISRIELGQKVLVTLQAYKDIVFEARVSRISPKMDDKTQTFEVQATFVKKPKRLFMGLTGEGNIVIHEKKQALVIPREFLLPGNMVETTDGTVHIQTGLSNWAYVEVLSGITKETEILKPE